MSDWLNAPFGKHWTDFISMFVWIVGIISIVIYSFKKYKIDFPKFKPFALLVISFWLVGMLFGQFYSAINYFDANSFANIPNSVSNWDFTYYSYCILTGLGPTDILPLSYLAKWTSLLEAGVSLLFLSVLISLLLSKVEK